MVVHFVFCFLYHFLDLILAVVVQCMSNFSFQRFVLFKLLKLKQKQYSIQKDNDGSVWDFQSSIFRCYLSVWDFQSSIFEFWIKKCVGKLHKFLRFLSLGIKQRQHSKSKNFQTLKNAVSGVPCVQVNSLMLQQEVNRGTIVPGLKGSL